MYILGGKIKFNTTENACVLFYQDSKDNKFKTQKFENLTREHLNDDFKIINAIYQLVSKPITDKTYEVGGYDYVCKTLLLGNEIEFGAGVNNTSFAIFPNIQNKSHKQTYTYNQPDVLEVLPQAFIEFNNYIQVAESAKIKL